MIKKSKADLAAYIFIGAALIVSLFFAWQRYDLERSHKQSQILLDWAQVYDAAQRSNIPLEEALAMFAPYCGGALIKEPTLPELQNQGSVAIKTAEAMAWDLKTKGLSEAKEANEAKEPFTYLIFSQKDDMQRALSQLKAKMPKSRSYIFPLEGENILATDIPYGDLSLLGMGFPKAWLEALSQAGLGVAVQIKSWHGFTPEGAGAVLDNIKDYEVLGIGFNDPDLPGVFLPIARYKEACLSWKQAIEGLNSSLITMEFYSQNGMGTMATVMEQNVLRLHSITERDMQTTVSREGAVDRYQLAASERNISLLLVRFLPHASLEENAGFFKEINVALWQKGIIQTKPLKFGFLEAGRLPLLIIALGVLAGAWLLARSFRLPLFWANIMAALGFIVAAGLLFTGRAALFQKIFPLLSVLVFPTLAIINFMPRAGLKPGQAVLRLLLTTAFSLIGALLMVGLLADGNYMLSLKIFSGVKLAHLIPILLVGAWFLFLREDENPLKKTSQTLNYPLTNKYLLIFAVIAGVLGIYLLRTGNDSMPLPQWERAFRALINKIMYVRPRTKEFLIGHPIMLLLFYLGYKDKFLPLLLLGTIGQVSLVNTFAHIHTPLIISALRTVNGLILGFCAGLILIIMLGLSVRAIKKYWPPAQEGLSKKGFSKEGFNKEALNKAGLKKEG